MSSENEAVGRIAIARFEARRKAEKASARAARMRLAVQILTSFATVAFAILAVRKNIIFPNQDWVFLVCTIVIISGWSNYGLRETSVELRAELDQLKALIEEQKAER